MASIRKELVVKAPPADVWAAVRAVGEIHTRLGRGFVTDTRLDGDSRVVTFADGSTAVERIVDIDDSAMRFVYAVVSPPFTHDNASMQVVPDGHGSRLIWQRDMLPNELAPRISAAMDSAVNAIAATLAAPASRQSSVDQPSVK